MYTSAVHLTHAYVAIIHMPRKYANNHILPEIQDGSLHLLSLMMLL